MQLFRVSAPYAGPGLRLTRSSPNTGPGFNALAQALATRQRNAPTPIAVKQTIPTKRQIIQYCMRDAEFARLYMLARASTVGSSKATIQLRSVRERVLRDLPFGPILPE
jgi:hypothetical protein